MTHVDGSAPPDPLSDSIDPAPRVLRMVAEALATDPVLRPVSMVLRQQALVLEGVKLKIPTEMKRSRWYCAAVQRRRVERRLQTTVKKALLTVKKDAPRLTAEDERERERMREAGLIGPETGGLETVEVESEIKAGRVREREMGAEEAES